MTEEAAPRRRATGSGGQSAWDPSRNVLDLVEAAIKRIDDMSAIQTKRLEEALQMHIKYTEQLAEAEYKRLDAIRAVDTSAVAIAAEKNNAQLAALNQQMTTSASTLRDLLAASGAAQQQQLKALASQLEERIAVLERSRYESAGRSGLSAPLLMTMAGVGGGLLVFIVESFLERGG